MQTLQKEREGLAAQVKSSGPELQRLSTELAAAKAAAADAVVMREQVRVGLLLLKVLVQSCVSRYAYLRIAHSEHDYTQ